MKLFRCLICGDAYGGNVPPSHCPYCGAEGRFVVAIEKWIDKNNVELSEISRNNLITAQNLENNATAEYRCAASKTKDPVLEGMFKYVAKMEAEHLSAILKILKTSKPAPATVDCADDDNANLKHGEALEQNAVKLYTKFAEEATEERVKEFFLALAHVEQDHIKIFEELMDR